MTMQKLYRLTCNEDDCDATGPVALTMEAARTRASGEGWDVGPHYAESRHRGRLTNHTDYCPAHKGAED